MVFYISIRNLAQKNEKMFEYLRIYHSLKNKKKYINTSFLALEIKMNNGAIFILRKDVGVGGWSRKWQFSLTLCSENVLT